MKEIGFNHPRKFVLGMAKRSERAGMKDKEGNQCGSIIIQRGIGTVSWDYAPPEVFKVDKAAGKKSWKGKSSSY
jgi:DNA polymerase elongation subunit (family B)